MLGYSGGAAPTPKESESVCLEKLRKYAEILVVLYLNVSKALNIIYALRALLSLKQNFHKHTLHAALHTPTKNIGHG